MQKNIIYWFLQLMLSFGYFPRICAIPQIRQHDPIVFILMISMWPHLLQTQCHCCAWLLLARVMVQPQPSLHLGVLDAAICFF